MLVKCEKCGKSYKVSDDSIGKKVKCQCGHRFVISGSGQTTTDAPPSIPVPTTQPQTEAANQPQEVAAAPQPVPIVTPQKASKPDSPFSIETNPRSNDSSGAVQTSQPTSVLANRRKQSSTPVILWAGVGGGLLLIIVLIVAFSQGSGKDNDVAEKNGKQKTSQKDAKEQRKKNDSKNTNQEKSLPRNDPQDQKSKQKPKSVIPPSTNGESGQKTSTGKTKGNSSQSIDFQPDTTIQIKMDAWDLPEGANLKTAIDAFPKTSGKEREINEEILIRGGKDSIPIIVEKIKQAETDRSIPFAIYSLCQTLSKTDPAAVSALTELVMDESLKDQTRSNAIRALGEMGPIAKSSIPELAKLFHSLEGANLTGLKLSVVNAFRNIGVYTDEVGSILKEILENQSGKYRLSYLTVALQACRNIGPDASPLVPAIEGYLLNGSNDSKEAADALAAVGAGAGVSAKSLATLVERDDKVVSYRMYHALRNIGPTASAAVPSLIKALESNSNDFTRSNIADALGRIGPDASGAIPILQGYLEEAERDEPDQQQRVVYRLAIARIQGNQADAIDYLRKSIYDNTHNARAEAVKQIGTLGKDGAALVPDLARIVLTMETKHSVVRLAIQSLGQLGEYGKDGLGALISFINREHLDPKGQKTYRLHAIDAIARINSDERVEQGLRLLSHHDPNIKSRDKARRHLYDLLAEQR